MKEIKTIIKIINDYIYNFNKNFEKITLESSTDLALKHVRISYIEDSKVSDSIPIHRYYPDYNFLNKLGKYEKEKILFLYSLKRYIDYLDFFEKLELKAEYLYYLLFNFDDEELKIYFDDGIIMFPSLVYYLPKDKSSIIGEIEWNKSVVFGKYILEIKDCFEKIIKDVLLEDYLDITYYYSDIGYDILIDFSFEYGKYKKRVKDYAK